MLTESNHEKIKARITKLLSMASPGRGASEAEMTLAMAKAQALAMQNNVDLAQLAIQDTMPAKIEVTDELRERLPQNDQFFHALNIAAAAADVTYVTMHYRFDKSISVHAFGGVSNLPYFWFVFEWAQVEMERQWKAYRKAFADRGTPLNGIGKRKSFYAGIMDQIKMAIKSRNEELKRQQVAQVPVDLQSKVGDRMALMVVDAKAAAEELKHETYPTLRKKRVGKVKGYDAYYAGRAAGKNVQVPGRGLGEGSTGLFLN